MSDHKSASRNARAADKSDQSANQSANTQKETEMSTTTIPTPVAPLGTATLEIASLDVAVPIKFAPGHVLTETQAKILDAAYQRQFTNNQNASAKSRAEAFAKAKTDAEKAAKLPLTAAQIAALYTDYEPAVGGTPRQSMMEKLRLDAAWRMWVAMVTDHNDAATKGGTPVIAKAVNAEGKALIVPLPTGKGAPEKREAMATALLALPAYADRIQVHLDAIMAERGTKTPAPAADTVVAAGVDLF